MSYFTDDCEMRYFRMKEKLMEKMSQEIHDDVQRELKIERAVEERKARKADEVARREFLKLLFRNNEVE